MRQLPCPHAVLPLLTALFVQVNTAHAEIARDRIWVQPVAIGGTIPDAAEWRKEFDRRVLDGVRRGRRVPFTARRGAVGCWQAACARALVEEAQVDGLLAAKVLLGAERPPSYRVTVSFYDRAHDDLRTREERCAGCTEFQAAELLTRLVVEALEVPAPAAEVAPSATTPSVPVAGQPTPSAAPAVPPIGASASPDPAARPRSRVWLGASLVALGAAGVVASGIALGVKIAQYDDDLCSTGFPTGRCPIGRDTRPGIIGSGVALGLSLAVGVTGAVLVGRSVRGRAR